MVFEKVLQSKYVGVHLECCCVVYIDVRISRYPVLFPGTPTGPLVWEIFNCSFDSGNLLLKCWSIYVVPSMWRWPTYRHKCILEPFWIFIEPVHGRCDYPVITSAALCQHDGWFQCQLLAQFLMHTHVSLLCAETTTIAEVISDAHANI